MNKDRTINFETMAIAERHFESLNRYSVSEIRQIFSDLWPIFEQMAKEKECSLSPECISNINKTISEAFEKESSEFIAVDSWRSFVDECGAYITDDPEHVFAWIFSSIYWNHVTSFKFSTALLFCSAFRVQHGFTPIFVAPENMAAFLHSLAASGPPAHDGQTFYLDRYS